MSNIELAKAKQQAGRAERGDLRALGTLLRDVVDALAGLTPEELDLIDGLTAGTVTASKAIIAGASKNIDTLTFTGSLNGPVYEVTTANSTVALPSYGTVSIKTSAATALTLSAPIAGCEVTLYRSGLTTEAQTITLTTAAKIAVTSHSVITMAVAGQAITLKGLDSDEFAVMSHTGSLVTS